MGTRGISRRARGKIFENCCRASRTEPLDARQQTARVRSADGRFFNGHEHRSDGSKVLTGKILIPLQRPRAYPRALGILFARQIVSCEVERSSVYEQTRLRFAWSFQKCAENSPIESYRGRLEAFQLEIPGSELPIHCLFRPVFQKTIFALWEAWLPGVIPLSYICRAGKTVIRSSVAVSMNSARFRTPSVLTAAKNTSTRCGSN